MVNIVWQSVINVLAPRKCLVCGNVFEETFTPKRFDVMSHICQRCFDRLPIAPKPDTLLGEIAKNFLGEKFAFSRIISRFAKKDDLEQEYLHEEDNAAVSEIIYAIKYHGMKDAGRAFGRELGETLQMLGWTDYDALVPVPIHSARKRERGYNQSDFIAQGVADILHIPVQTAWVHRKNYTLSQTYFSFEERKENVRNVFAVNPQKVQSLRGASILLIDDILTTGSTLNACGVTLLEGGAKRIDAATLAKA
ncbi:MAG: hypothetical protein MUF71_18735 [Candidatus Kapabacteria bacterium]|jgi:ComF family protein|nr:hypothetical protein [Candidatus Kapabacteria bacterium]